jgi:subtilisin family serine protease
MKIRFVRSCVALFSAALLLVMPLSAQTDAPPKDWFHLNQEVDGYAGVSSKQAYEFLKNKKSRTVVVAVIDSGVDIEHEDLKDVIWVNADEIPGNGIDDDKNGYIDDVNGWNFIGGKDGSQIAQDALEMTRIVAAFGPRFAGKDEKSIDKSDAANYKNYTAAKAVLDADLAEAQAGLKQYQSIADNLDKVLAAAKSQGIEGIKGSDLESISVEEGSELAEAMPMVKMIGSRNPDVPLAEIRGSLDRALEYFGGQVNFHLNVNFDPRGIVGDNYANSDERYYGNNLVEGPDAFHGTHVAGIIAAARNNGIGMDGIADNVRIMVLRAVPDGDERDKDVANSIRYAVDNGAQIINMSFGKGFSWDKKVVDDAVAYATSKGVLLVHAAGNESLNVDKEDRFPTKYYAAGGSSSTWFNIGAGSWKKSPKQVGGFTNYGKKNVDLFSPGVAIYSTIPDSKYDNAQGTSMAAPAAAGVAAVLMSYYPAMTAQDVIAVLMKSSVKSKEKVTLPGSDKEVKFNSLSKSGGRIDLYRAVQMADKKFN